MKPAKSKKTTKPSTSASFMVAQGIAFPAGDAKHLLKKLTAKRAIQAGYYNLIATTIARQAGAKAAVIIVLHQDKLAELVIAVPTRNDNSDKEIITTLRKIADKLESHGPGPATIIKG